MKTRWPRFECSVKQGLILLILSAITFTQSADCLAQFAVGGIYIDAEGVLHRTSVLSQNERLELLRKEAFAPASSETLSSTSELRKISLKRLEKTIKKLQADNKPIPADVRYLAGLQKIQHVFFYPESGDVVLAGPAEGWQQVKTGEVVGQKTNRPVLHLDDLLVALRYAFGQKNGAPFLGCSIDPTVNGQQRYVSYMNKIGRFDRSRVRELLTGMSTAMGLQKITLFGAPQSSRFSLIMVAADYRLKRIAMGHDRSPVKGVTNYLDLAAKKIRSPKALGKQHRWWFAAEYDAVLHSPDRLSYEFQGQGVKVVTGVNLGGQSTDAKPSPVATLFAKSFTRFLPEISKKLPIFAELQNLIGLSVAAELIAQRSKEQPDVAAIETSADGEPDSTNVTPGFWKPTFFLNDRSLAIQQYIVPTKVNSIANVRLVRGKHWMFSVSGGVQIEPTKLIEAETTQESNDRTLIGRRSESHLPEESDRWWWD